MDTYFVRSRGKLAGPFEMDALQQLVKRGKVSRFDQLSTDKAAWRAAGDYAELFAPPAPRRSMAVATAPEEPAYLEDDLSPLQGGTAASGVSGGSVNDSTAFYYAQNGAAVGPMAIAILQTLATNGTLLADDPVWAEGSDIATPAWQVPMLASHFSQKKHGLSYSGGQSGELRYAGFWLRVVAFVIDSIIAGGGAAIISFGAAYGVISIASASRVRPADAINLAGGSAVIVQNVAIWLYFALMESSANKATLGKQCLGLYVSGVDGEQISFGLASGRYFAKFLSSLLFCIGFIMAAFTARKQALHDFICSTLVVEK